ncbi:MULTISPECIES: helix-turn-helix domain-containing protein [Aliiruegeria]|uniref:DNA binding domain-containing protein, excisionase family n=1 Tax=Aliiruegeria lutimaris TaxID=571298 RepID=A0A1G9DMJ4_9RHOB|nr:MULTISPECIES: helix-turn-helix domain-containing protein [Aliiruegeria]NDR55663.1 helix-turn-helix domain-containing protein [Pseudoruegeria sp. M32A2M]SDK64995.1 DNA binding domain-containing protein, excisionase family [Aliiruegeria lutimaris]
MKMLKVEQVAKELQLSVRTVRRLIEEGVIPVHRIGRSVRVSEDDLKRYIASCRQV